MTTVKDKEDVRKMIEDGYTHQRIADYYNVRRPTITEYLKKHNIKKVHNYEYHLTPKQENLRKMLIEKYAHKFFDILQSQELNPDLHDLLSVLGFQSIKCAMKYDPKRSAFGKYLVKHFWWIFSNYRKKLLKSII